MTSRYGRQFTLCWAQPSDGRIVACDRVRDHKGSHSWDIGQVTDAVQAAQAAGLSPITILDTVARAIYHPETLVTVTSPEVPEIAPGIAEVTADMGLSRRGRDGYLRVSLIVKAGMSTEDILRARAIAVRKLNEWFCEDSSGTAPYEIGSLLSYSVHDEEHLSPIGRMSKGNVPAR